MTTIVLISTRYLEFFEFDKVLQPDDRLVGIFEETEMADFPQAQKKHFDVVHSIPQQPRSGAPLEEYDYAACKNIISKELQRCHNHDLIISCVDEINLLLACRLRADLGIPGANEQQRLVFRDKLLMKKKLAQANLAIPLFTAVDSSALDKSTESYYNQLTSQLGLPFVIKPTDFAGSYGTAVIHNLTEFKDFVKQGYHKQLAYEAEAFIDGELFHCDFCVDQNNHIIFRECCRYTCPNLNFVDGHIIASLILTDDEPQRQRLIDAAMRYYHQLGEAPGSYHMELFLTKDDEVYFLEAAARPPGAAAPPMYGTMFGTGLCTLNLLIELDRPLPDQHFKGDYCAFAMLPINKSTINNFLATNFSSKLIPHWYIDPANFDATNSLYLGEVAAKVLLVNPDYHALKDDFELIKQCSLPRENQHEKTTLA